MHRPRTHACLAVSLLFLLALPTRADSTLAGLLHELHSSGRLRIAGTTIVDTELLQRFYAARGQQIAWDDAGTRASLVEAVRAVEEEGLRADDYHPAALAAAVGLPREQADLLHTDALIRLASDHFHGRLDPVTYTPQTDLLAAEPGADPVLWLERSIAAGAIPTALAELVPRTPLYGRLKAALASYREIARHGGWGAVATGPTLHPGERSVRVPALRARLRASGDLDDSPADDENLYDAPLAGAVRAFQARHLLAVDGVTGIRTQAALNVPVSQRIDQIRVNLERARWLLHDLPPTYVLVDIAGFEVRYVRDGVELLRSRATVGRTYRKTPVFRSSISHLEFNPAWTVPPTILEHDVLPAIRRDPGYLARRDMRVLTMDGHEVDPGTIDWNHYRGRNFPWLIRQAPGPHNSLGQIKFTFPNAYMVYLHDTPERALFARPERTFSSGCIRVEQARQLARLLLEVEGHDAPHVEALFDDVRTRRVNLANPVPILLYYWTVTVAKDATVIFKRDIYDRDAALLAALDRLRSD